MAVLTSWTALDDSEPVDGARDLLGTGAIADRLAEQIAPNLRQGTNRARYYTMLAVGTRVVDATSGTLTSGQRLRLFFQWERLWLAALFEHHLPADGSVPKLQNAIKTKEDGLLGAGIRGASSRKFIELREASHKIDLDEFAPLKSPQTSGVYGRYAGSARDVKVLSDAGLALGAAGSALAESFEETLGQQQFFSRAAEAVAAGTCSTKAAMVRSLGTLRLTRPQGRERELLTEYLIEGTLRTRLAATVLRQHVEGSNQLTRRQWLKAVPKCATAAAALGDEGLADALRGVAGYDALRSALEALLVAASNCAERNQTWEADDGLMSKDRTFMHHAELLREAAKVFASSPDLEATQRLRTRLHDHDLSTVSGVLALLCDQHEAVCSARGTAVWARLERGGLSFSRRITGATSGGLARYRLGSLASLIRDLQWKGAA